MPGLELLLPFLITAVLLSITPGPGLLYMAAQTVGRGRGAGLWSAAGTHLASYLHILAAAFGLSLVLQTVPLAFATIKIAGAAYLFWIGARFVLSGRDGSARSATGSARQKRSALKDGFLVELTNPKSALFFLAFLPPFTDPEAAYAIWVQILLLGVLANAVFSLAEVGSVIFADKVALRLRRSNTAALWMRRLAGSIMVALGFRLLLSER